MLSRLLLLVLALASFSGTQARALSVGANRGAVIGELGEPSSQASRGNVEILSYPRGVRVILVNGRVDRAEGVELTVFPDAFADPSEAPRERDSLSTDEDPGAEGESSGPHGQASAHAVSRSSAPVETPQRTGAEDATEEEEDSTLAPGTLPVAAALVLLGLHLVVTLIGLKIAFRYWEMDAFLSGMLAIAVIDVVLHAALAALGPLTGGITSMRAVENGIPGFVMIFTIRHYCFNKDLSDAIQTAAVVKVAVILIKAFAAMTVMSAFS